MTNLFIIKTAIILFLSFSCISAYPQAVSQQQFNFKGFSIKINDDALDENGNHLFVGEIWAIETTEANRDSNINKIFRLKGHRNDDRTGIIITADKNYSILQITESFSGKKAVYDRNKKQFTIGANFLSDAWQPVIIQIDLQLKAKEVYFIKRPYSCFLENIAIENNEILIFTSSQPDELKYNEKAEVIRVATSRSHDDSTRPWIRLMEPLSSLETPYNDIGKITLSDVSKADSAYYFTTSNFDQARLKNVNHLYQLKNNKLTEVQYSSDYFKYLNWDAKTSDFIDITEFTANSTKNYLFLTHEFATKTEMVFSKTDERLNNLLSKKIPLNDYADFNKMLVLSNEKIVILAINDKKIWSYFLYDSNMQLIKEINSTISKDYIPSMLKETVNDHLECTFNIDHVNRKDYVLQTINLN